MLGGGPMVKLPIDVQIKAVEREIRKRLSVYPRFIETSRMSQQEAEHQIQCMRNVLETLRSVEAGTRLI
jgi:hypothetical protein